MDCDNGLRPPAGRADVLEKVDSWLNASLAGGDEDDDPRPYNLGGNANGVGDDGDDNDDDGLMDEDGVSERRDSSSKKDRHLHRLRKTRDARRAAARTAKFREFDDPEQFAHWLRSELVQAEPNSTELYQLVYNSVQRHFQTRSRESNVDIEIADFLVTNLLESAEFGAATADSDVSVPCLELTVLCELFVLSVRRARDIQGSKLLARLHSQFLRSDVLRLKRFLDETVGDFFVAIAPHLLHEVYEALCIQAPADVQKGAERRNEEEEEEMKKRKKTARVVSQEDDEEETPRTPTKAEAGLKDKLAAFLSELHAGQDSSDDEEPSERAAKERTTMASRKRKSTAMGTVALQQQPGTSSGQCRRSARVEASTSAVQAPRKSVAAPPVRGDGTPRKAAINAAARILVLETPDDKLEERGRKSRGGRSPIMTSPTSEKQSEKQTTAAGGGGGGGSVVKQTPMGKMRAIGTGKPGSTRTRRLLEEAEKSLNSTASTQSTLTAAPEPKNIRAAAATARARLLFEQIRIDAAEKSGKTTRRGGGEENVEEEEEEEYKRQEKRMARTSLNARLRRAVGNGEEVKKVAAKKSASPILVASDKKRRRGEEEEQRKTTKPERTPPVQTNRRASSGPALKSEPAAKRKSGEEATKKRVSTPRQKAEKESVDAPAAAVDDDDEYALPPIVLNRYKQRMSAILHARRAAIDDVFYGRHVQRSSLFDNEDSEDGGGPSNEPPKMKQKGSPEMMAKSRTGRAIIQSGDHVDAAHALLNVYNKEPLAAPPKPLRAGARRSSTSNSPEKLQRMVRVACKSARRSLDKLRYKFNSQQRAREVVAAANGGGGGGGGPKDEEAASNTVSSAASQQ